MNRLIAILLVPCFLIAFSYSGDNFFNIASTNDTLKKDTKTPSSATNQSIGKILVKSINFRIEPNSDAQPVLEHPVLYWRTMFVILKEEGDWCRIRLFDGTEGWLRSNYEGKPYIAKSTLAVNNYPPIDSHQFYILALAVAKEWDENCNLDFIYGDEGGLDGRCCDWIALFYSNTKPKQKLMCEYSVQKGVTSEAMETEKFEYMKQNIDGLPGYWWQNEGTYARPGFINSSDLCTAKNLEPFLNWKMDVTAPLHQEEFKCRFILGKDDWTISIGAILTSWVYMSYEAKTGKLRKTDSNAEPMTGSEG